MKQTSEKVCPETNFIEISPKASAQLACGRPEPEAVTTAGNVFPKLLDGAGFSEKRTFWKFLWKRHVIPPWRLTPSGPGSRVGKRLIWVFRAQPFTEWQILVLRFYVDPGWEAVLDSREKRSPTWFESQDMRLTRKERGQQKQQLDKRTKTRATQ